MSIDKSEFEALKAKKARRAHAVPQATPLEMTQAAVEMGHLLDDSTWSPYQKRLQECIGVADGQLRQIMLSMLTAKSSDELWMGVAAGRERAGYIAAMQQAQMIPGELKKLGDEVAEEQLKEAANG